MKYLYSFLAVILLSFFAQAQTFGLNFTNAIPTGDFSQSVNLGYVGGVSLIVPAFGTNLVAYGGYGFWDEASTPSADKFSFTNFPVVLAGARSYLFDGDFYLTTLAGIYPVKLTVENSDGKSEIKETQGSVLAGFGYVFPVSFFHLDLSFNYLWNQDYPQSD